MVDKGRKVEVVREPFDLNAAVELVSTPYAGGYVVFLGRVRKRSEGKEVIKLNYETYEEMAVAEMERIRKEAMERFPILDMLIWHRVGELEVGEDTILIIASGEHRGEAFDACRWAIDEVKHRVPVWKKEVREDGNFWIEGDKWIPEDYHGG
ncbi:molybdenum cofactor biosynthesis protein MoaE [Thermococcus sp. Bubb.Bath]|uniref:molybdenum cofactor biosynthesis protein MoaE n=1 Tax=Thermococcus sp. Bubb.Bath TaxID=1638242 RepID=UPI001438D41E|nr:molybdenum cofactor biosynthesis protein MoaE [Thermococcus sp. Bubb.Bath]NJF25858.1 molybdenum cofactor biosynthesis protein MoaE [Thermococcus sp. Bubb.Bath]